MQGLNYDAVGATQVGRPEWTMRPDGFRRLEHTVPLGSDDRWDQTCEAILRWAVKARSGFSIEPAPGESLEVRPGADLTVRAGCGPWSVSEPVRVVEVVATQQRCGFSYGTRTGHPVRGEEAFVVHRRDGRMWLTLRSLTRAGEGRWRWVFPAALVAQRWYRRRYERALLPSRTP
ncbi:DUF1990 domain-containing protein [Nocardioides sp. BP30]|uniref:DUF1990 family protein n=1 Tax=Nocardioides sp. BP30 TaxID=3036374 RepID=UPI002468CE06|nr:DUF1990 domain-containing protein [Nocardioides sp. BP30]WGL53429.1 DUF1990 domain-containing protein [Nocardioides sp. BP30]